jgi:hypothetical protein
MGSPEIADVFVPVPVIEPCDKRKRKHRRSLRKHVAAVAERLPVLPLLSAVHLLLRSCGVSLLPCRAAALCRSALPVRSLCRAGGPPSPEP